MSRERIDGLVAWMLAEGMLVKEAATKGKGH
jgi:hypothetical protein